MKKLLFGILMLGICLQSQAKSIYDELSSSTNKFIAQNYDSLITQAVNKKVSDIMKKLTSDYDYTEDFKPQHMDDMFAKGKAECLSVFETKQAKELCGFSVMKRVHSTFKSDYETYYRDQNIEEYNQGKDLICDFNTINGKEIRAIVNQTNSELYRNEAFIRNDIFIDIRNCESKQEKYFK